MNNKFKVGEEVFSIMPKTESERCSSPCWTDGMTEIYEQKIKGKILGIYKDSFLVNFYITSKNDTSYYYRSEWLKKVKRNVG